MAMASKQKQRDSSVHHLLPEPPLYTTPLGAAYCGGALQLLRSLPPNTIDLTLTSPPYALNSKKEYHTAEKDEYVSWFLPFGEEIHRTLKPSGSFILNLAGSYNPGIPTRSLYHYHVLLMLCEDLGFHLAQECFWQNPAKLPSPAEWVNVRRIRLKDSIEYLWWLSKTSHPKADNRNVLTEYSQSMWQLLASGTKAATHPSGHHITTNFLKQNHGSIPGSLITCGNTESNSPYLNACRKSGAIIHPARFPKAIPTFFIKLLTNKGDIILDPFAGSNTTGFAAESLHRQWLAFEISKDYLEASKARFAREHLEATIPSRTQTPLPCRHP